MLHSVRATIVLLPLNIIAIWITPNRKKDVYHKTDFNSMRRPLVLYSCTEKSMIQNHGKLRVACQLIKSFVMLYGTKLSYTGDGYHLKMF